MKNNLSQNIIYTPPGPSKKLTVFSIGAAIMVAFLTVWFLPFLDGLFPQKVKEIKAVEIEKTELIKEKKKPTKIYQTQQKSSKKTTKLKKPEFVKKRSIVKPKTDIPMELTLNSLQMDSDMSLNFSLSPASEAVFEGEGLDKLVFDLDEVDKKPVPLGPLMPHYPLRARRRNIEGWVKVTFIIDDEGKVTDVNVIDSSPKNYFENAAVNAVSKRKWKPGEEAGEKVAVKFEQTVRFKLGK